MKKRLLFITLCLGLALPVPLLAQAPRDARLAITVADPSGAVIPNATVTIVDSGDPSKTFKPAATTDKGVALFEGLTPGRYTVRAEFSGFEAGTLKDVRVRAGENKHIVILGLKKVEESITVGQEAQAAAADPHGNAFKTILTREEIEALSDDPSEMAQQLLEMASANAVIRIDSFFGGPLPPKAQIKSIHIVRDAFAAENHSAESDEIQIITQPGVGPIHGGGTSRFRDGSMSGRSPFTLVKGPERTENFEGNVGGSLIKNKSSFSISVGRRSSFDTPVLNVVLPGGGTRSEVMNLRRPNDNWSVFGLFDYAITRDQTLRLSYDAGFNDRKNLGVGGYDLEERAYTTVAQDHEIRAQIVGPLGRRVFANTRLQMQWDHSTSHSAVEAPTIRILDAATRGGAQVAGGRHPRDIEFASDIDYIRGIHTVRGGVLIDSGWHRSDDSTNYLGTYTFSSLAAFDARQPASFTRRIGNPLIRYQNTQAAAYIQDDVRVNKGLTLSPGVRYEAQTHLHDLNNIAPRFGLNWAPSKSGRTTLRASYGVFYNWLNAGTYEQTLRVDGFRQQQIDIVDPGFPAAEIGGVVPPTSRFLLDDDVQMVRTLRLSAGVDQTLSPTVRVSVSYSNVRSANVLRGMNLNAPVSGLRPNPAFANVIDVTSDAEAHTQQIATTLNVNFAPNARAASQPRWNWHRTTARFSYWLSRAENNTDGPFIVPASGRLSTEWGPSQGDRRHRVQASINTQTLKNLNAGLTLAGNSGAPYTITTGRDNNGDSIFNDRPSGIGRNTLRTPWQLTWTSAVSYSIGFGTPTAVSRMQEHGGSDRVAAQTGARYRLVLSLHATNLTNRANYVGFSGVMTSPFFQQATAVANPRKIDIGMSFRF
jgi:Carboxypeptidase regulatory-like domain/TonB dependent receptor-like, beta-barrel